MKIMRRRRRRKMMTTRKKKRMNSLGVTIKRCALINSNNVSTPMCIMHE